VLACILGLQLTGCDPEVTSSGQRCATTRECHDSTCVADVAMQAEDLAELDLVCAARVGDRHAGSACERGAQCASGICLLAGACAEPCRDEIDCGARQRCQAVYARGGNDTFQTLRACVGRVDLPRAARVTSEVREAVWTGAVDRVALPAASAPTLFVIEHLDDDTWPVPSLATPCRPPLCAETLVAADEPDRALFDRANLEDEAGPINPIAQDDHVDPLTVLVPNGPRSRPAEAGLVLRAESKRPGAARITTLSHQPSGGRLDLNVYYVGARDLEPGADGMPALLVEVLDEVDRIFEPADIYVGEVREVVVAGSLLERGTPLPGAEASEGLARLRLQYRVYPQLPELFKLSAGAGNVAVNVFFVADIEPGTSGDLGGIAGGTPIPFGMHGTPGSGIAIATDNLLNDPTKIGRNLAHELGHALGLFHTSEINGQVYDPLPDTPTCRMPQQRDCGNNLMFPTTEASASQLTPDQIDVLRQAMVLQ
jgi:hypothetical protein